MPKLRKPELEALEVLKKAGITKPPVDVKKLLEQESVRLEYRALEDHVSGCLVHSDKRQVVVVVNQRHAPTRQNFTLAHELAHFRLHGNQPTLFVDDAVVHFRVGSGSTDPKEVEANAFAAMLLMPDFMLRDDLKDKPLDAFDEEAVLRLAKRYGVSQQALTIQLVHLGLFDGLGPRATKS